MSYDLSTKLDATLRYISGSGLYGVAASTLADIATALANAATVAAALVTHAASTTAHAAATTTANGFLAFADQIKLNAIAAGQDLTIGRATVDAILEAPSVVTYATAVTLDTSQKNDFVIGALTGNIAITLSNPAAGRQGLIAVRQDGTGTRTVSIAATGYTNYHDVNTIDLIASPAANAIVVYTYAMLVVGGVSMLLLGKLTAVTP
jgi:hypothetical protein